MLDPRTHAVRSDIADVRLAERVFAPHYAAPMIRSLATPCPLREAPAGGETLTDLIAGDVFEVLEISGSQAWGIATRPGLVGYVDATSLEGVAA